MRESEPNNLDQKVIIGPGLADVIKHYLGNRLAFPDSQDELARMCEHIDELESAEFDTGKFVLARYNTIFDKATKDGSERLGVHTKMMAHDKIYLADSNDEESWHQINREDKPLFVEATEKALADFTNDLPQNLLNFIDSTSEAGIVGSIDKLFTDVEGQLCELFELIPAPNLVIGHSPIGRIALKARRKQLHKSFYDEYNLPSHPDIARKVSRKARKLNEMLSAFLEDTELFAASIITEQLEPQLRVESQFWLDQAVMKRHEEAMQLIPKGKRPIERPEREEIPEPQQVKVIIEETAEEAIKETTQVELGKYKVELPWLNKGKATAIEMELVTTYEGQALIARAVAPGKLSEIAGVARSKSPTKKDEQNIYDLIACRQAELVANGIMPYGRANIKHTHAGKDTDYAGTSIWYTFDRSPNPPRVYFTLKKVEEITSASEIDRMGVKPETNVIVILGETDKANQVNVLTALTGKDARRLRNTGAGPR